MKLISIIVPVYNVEKYLSRCIDSLLNQSYKNLEIILVDDGSTDDSGNICDVYAKNYKNVYVYHKKNEGISSARNLGIEKINTNTEYVAFVDSDDFIHPNMYEILHDNLMNIGADISVCNYEMVYKKDNYMHNIENNVKELSNQDAISNYFENFNIFNFVWNKLYKREIIESVGFEIGRMFEDQIYSPQVIYKSKKIAITDAKLYYYYQREGSTLNSIYDEQKLEDFFYAAKYQVEFGKQIDNKKFKSNSIERYFYEMINKTINSDEKVCSKWRKKYRKEFKKHIFKIENNKAKLMYLLYYISPKSYFKLNNK